MVALDNLDALFDYGGEAPARLAAVLAKLAQETGHPELPEAPLLTVGHSTSGIFARNVAYWRPERVLGVVHLKSGNLHQHRPDPARTLAGVPFLAINGEFEEFGPEGGIRPEFGNQTKWVMIREQLLRWRRADPRHFVGLAVHPGGGHGDWAGELSVLVARFIRGSCRLRLPHGSEPAAPEGCRGLPPGAGWLYDARLASPRHPAAPADRYTGPTAEAFWVPDAASARAIETLHRDRLLLPEPDRPVPAGWPPVPAGPSGS